LFVLEVRTIPPYSIVVSLDVDGARALELDRLEFILLEQHEGASSRA